MRIKTIKKNNSIKNKSIEERQQYALSLMEKGWNLKLIRNRTNLDWNWIKQKSWRYDYDT